MRKILAIDDQSDNLTTIKAVVKMMLPNIEVLTAQSGKEGIRIANENKLDAILLDIIMPGIDGFEVCRILKKEVATQHIPVMMVTALRTDSESKVKALELGADAFVLKPFEPVELIAQLKVILRTKEAEDNLREERNKLQDIVEQRTKKIKENELKYRLLVESSQEPVLVINKGIVQFANSVTSLLSGYKNDELVGSSFIEYVHKDDQKIILDNYKKRANGENPIDKNEFRIVCKSGKTRWFNFKTNTIEWGNKTALQYILIDISDRLEIDRQKEINAERDNVLLELYNISLSVNDKAIFDFVLDKAVTITKSQIGFFHKFNEDLNTIELTSFNHRALDHCEVEHETHYPIGKAGNWVDCVREKRIITYNDFPNSPNQKGLPEGHVSLKNYMSVPVILKDKIVYIFGIGNKEEDYNTTDERNLNIIANELSKIFEKRGNEEIVKRSTEKYFAIHNNAPLPFQSLNSDGNIIEVNPAWLKTLGYQRHEVIGRWYGDFLHEEYKPLFQKNFPKLKTKGEVRNVPFKVKTKNGDYIDIKLDGSSGYSSNGAFLQTYCTFKNVTEELEQQKKLEISEAKYRSFVEHFQGIAFRKNASNLLDLVEGNVTEITGYSNQDFLSGKINFDLLIHPEDLQRVKNEDVDFIGSNATKLNSEFRIIDKTGFIHWIYETTTKFTLNNETWIYGTLQDITKLKEASMSLEESSSFNKSLIDTIPFPMEIVDESGTILFMNPVLEELIGKEMLGKKCWLLKDNNLQCTNCPLKEGIELGITNKIETNGVLNKRSFEITHRSMLFEGKKAMMEIFIDITENKKFEAELIEAKDKAVENDKLKSAFLANMSHEIRTPMNGILGFLDLLQDAGLTDLEKEQFMNVVKASGERLLNTINDIIELSKIESGETPIHFTEQNLSSYLVHLLGFFSVETKAKGVQLNIEKVDLVVKTDFGKLDSILTNLIKNAIKFTKEGSITVNCKQINNKLQISVKDTGIGIAPEKLEMIFGRFIQADNRMTRGYEGSGLGLAICKGYANALGGDIWVESELGTGSTFYCTISLEKVNTKQKTNNTAMQKQASTPNSKKQILVAEDDEMSFLLIKTYLEDTNLEIIYAENGEEAITKLKENPLISIILMDLKMPVLDGLTATKRIRQFNKAIPIIAQTAFALLGDKDTALKAGCTDYLSKPIKKHQLHQVLEKHLKYQN